MTSDTDTPASRLVIEAVRAALGRVPGAPDSTFAVALSGGLDSTVLLDAAVRCAGAARVVALHVHHGLSPNADAWAAHGEAFADSLGVRFAARNVDVVRAGGESLEAAARDARYRALDELCAEHGAAALWLAHHADDQAETVLLQLLRGAGVAGLAAMAPQTLDGALPVPRVRPLLELLRAQLEQYAHERDLNWIDDDSNLDTRYARNALRHEVLPVLAVHFPGFRDALARTASHAASAQRLLDDLARIDLAGARRDHRDEEGALALDALLAFDDERAINLLRYWTRLCGLPAASTARIADMLRQLRDAGSARDGHALRIDHAGHCLRAYRGAVYWEAGDSADAPDLDEGAAIARAPVELQWAGEEVWHLPQWRGTLVFEPVDAADAADTNASSDAIAESVLRAAPLSARSRAGGERMRLAAGAPGRTLKNLFQERGVPAWKRDVPLVFIGDALLFVPLIGVNRDAVSGTHGPCRRIVWRPDLLLA
ncbi:tRNA(Ile)-lysidine synthetase [Caballeronia glathei]|uniref:tRNA(Ile)-lysidine synthase n=1 Tax=Caballeronia glathei TaxID=60547 RepID=A0A069PU45_9BURK|nr:tRNA lysidine(34) synthetase TilS [Caballeronia glathei]KDR43364.1 tRNA(Ile)-lysidine synthetase [Caballeronia glathei]CDY78727.1 tRNA(Ile)-lysidine synthetase [Caballeronia glathei]